MPVGQHGGLREFGQLWRQRHGSGQALAGCDDAVFSVYGYTSMDSFIAAAQAAGPNLTTEGFIKAMETIKFPTDMFGTPEQKYGPTKRQGSALARLSQIHDGKWKVISDYTQ